MGSLIGWNIEGGDLNNRRATIQSELQSYRANWHLFLGDEGLMLSTLPYVDKGVIYRVFDPFHEWTDGGAFDNSFWQNHSPDDIISYVQVHLSHLLQYDNIVFSIGNNEPGTKGNTKQFLDWCIDLANKGKQAGIRFAIAEIATAKSVWHDEVQNGLWDAFIRTMDKYRGFHIFTVHEYTTGLLPACLLPDYPLNLDTPDLLKQSNWQNAKINTDTIEGNYHIGRGALVSHVRAKQIGITPLPFVVTECAFDWNADVMESDDPIQDQLRRERIGNLRNAFKPTTNHDVLRGSTGHQRYHEWIMQKTGFQGDWNDYLFEQYRWLVDAYPSECEGLNIFALNHDWDEPQGHDMSNARNDKFRYRVTQEPLTKGDDIVTVPIVWNPELYDYKVSVNNGFWNLRSEMTANSQDIGDITTEPRPMKVSSETLSANGYNWYKFTEGNLSGYFADTDKLVLEAIVNNTPDEPDTPIDDTTLADLVETAINARFSALTQDVFIDIPIPAFTFTIPEFARESKANEYEGLAKFYQALADRIRQGTPTASQIADTGFKASSVSSADWLDDSGNISITNTDEPTILSVIMNDEDDNEDLKIAS